MRYRVQGTINASVRLVYIGCRWQIINDCLKGVFYMAKQDASNLKRKIKRRAMSLGMNLIGFADVERWAEQPLCGEEYWPQSIWPWSRTVISMAVQIFPSMLETTPSVVYSELYNTTNRLLDEAAYRLANYLNTLGFRAHFFPRDCYGDISVLVIM